jgi:hypothetical protein
MKPFSHYLAQRNAVCGSCYYSLPRTLLLVHSCKILKSGLWFSLSLWCFLWVIHLIWWMELHIFNMEGDGRSSCHLPFCFLFFVVDTGVWTQGLTLAKQALYDLSTKHTKIYFSFCCSYFWKNLGLVFMPWSAWTATFLFFLCSRDDRHPPLCPATGWNGVSWNFCLGCPWTTVFLISISQVAGITGVSYCAWTIFFSWKKVLGANESLQFFLPLRYLQCSIGSKDWELTELLLKKSWPPQQQEENWHS